MVIRSLKNKPLIHSVQFTHFRRSKVFLAPAFCILTDRGTTAVAVFDLYKRSPLRSGCVFTQMNGIAGVSANRGRDARLHLPASFILQRHLNETVDASDTAAVAVPRQNSIRALGKPLHGLGVDLAVAIGVDDRAWQKARAKAVLDHLHDHWRVIAVADDLRRDSIVHATIAAIGTKHHT